MKERIQKILANAGIASRRNIEDMVREGRVQVNGKVIRDLPILIDPAKDRIVVDSEPVRLGSPGTEARYYILMNKPKGVYSTNVAQGEQVRAIDLLPPNFPARVYPVGQLDAESKGLLLLTNDGELTNRLTHPRYGIPKTYRAVVDGYLDPAMVQRLEKGIWVGDRAGEGTKSGAGHLRVTHRSRQQSILEITIREGRNRQIRRMLAERDHKIRELTRIRIGPLTLEGLAPGQFRALTQREVRDLRKIARHADVAAPGGGKREGGPRPTKPNSKGGAPRHEAAGHG